MYPLARSAPLPPASSCSLGVQATKKILKWLGLTLGVVAAVVGAFAA